jgi:hypothetical protein
MPTDTNEEPTTVTDNQSFDDVPMIDFTNGILPDYARDEREYLIEVDVPECGNLTLAGHLVPQGKSRLLVRGEDLPKIKALVRTEEQEKNLSMAADQFKRDQQREWDLKVQQFLTNGGSPDPYDPEFRALKHEHEAKRLGSVTATHVRLFQSEAPPLRSMRIIEGGILNKRDVERVEQEKAHAAALATSMQTAASGAANSAASGEQAAVVASAVAEAVAAVMAKHGIGTGQAAAPVSKAKS